MSQENGLPTLPGEVWRGRDGDVWCCVTIQEGGEPQEWCSHCEWETPERPDWVWVEGGERRGGPYERWALAERARADQAEVALASLRRAMGHVVARFRDTHPVLFAWLKQHLEQP